MLNERMDCLTETLRDYCIRVIRYVSNTALDPHLYFEKKLTGDVAVATTDAELGKIIAELAEWFAETSPEPRRLAAFDAELSAESRPTWSSLLNSETCAAGLLLAAQPLRSAKEHELLQNFIAMQKLSAADLQLAQQVVAQYESF